MKFLVLISMTLLALTGCFKKAQLGSEGNPVKLYFTPSVDADTITTNSKDFVQFLEKETGMFFETGVPSSYVAVVEAFGSKRADIGVINSFSYLMANQKYGASAKLKVIRYGKDYYQGQIITRADSGIDDLKGINGKKFAYTDPASTSGYMFPKKVLLDENVKVGEHVFAGKHDSVVTMVYQGQVDAGATFYSAPHNGKIGDARARVMTQFPGVIEKVKILKITEKIPNDPFVFRKDLPEAVTNKFIGAVKKYIQSEKGKKVFEEIYSVDGVVDANDQDYNGLRAMVKAVGVDLSSMVN